MANVLIVEDEKEVVLLMRFVLEKAGHTVSEAGNGRIALKVLGVEPPDPGAVLPDLVVLDVMMPIVDGYTAALSLRGDERTKDLPIIVVTAKGDMRQLFEQIPSVFAYLQKPFDPKTLRELVEKAVRARP